MKHHARSITTLQQGLFRHGLITLYCLIVLLLLVPYQPTFARDSMSIDVLMGGKGRTNHEKRISTLVFGNGKTYGWADFSAWGKELFLAGSVKSPPMDTHPSKPVSELFTCIKCHNYEREDPDLAVQDPEARFQWIESTGAPIFLLQGATMFGVVNRETFYPDYFTMYHNLCVPKEEIPPLSPCGPMLGICGPGCRTMNPDNLADAIQVCSAYCSVGRYLDVWELYSLMAFFWDQEIRLQDLGFSEKEHGDVLAVLTSPFSEPQQIQEARGLLHGMYAKKAHNTYRGIPTVGTTPTEGPLVVEYADGAKVSGDSSMGERLWPLSCGRCHGTENIPKKAQHFTKDVEKFHKMIAAGTRHSHKRYMPNFTLERLSRQQSADILEYLRRVALQE